MEHVEKGAVEAMLHLSRPTTLSSIPSDPVLPSAQSPTLHTPHPLDINAPIQLTTNTEPNEPKLSDITSGSSISPSPSPMHVRQKPQQTSNAQAAIPKATRPYAMRLSQLLTHTAADEHTPPHSAMQQRFTSYTVLPHTPLPLPPLKLVPQPTSIPLTEPVTPPFSPPVLPPLSSVTGMQDLGAGGTLGAGDGTLNGWNGGMMNMGTEWECMRGGSNRTVGARGGACASRYRDVSVRTQVNATCGVVDGVGGMIQTGTGGANEVNDENGQVLNDVPAGCVENKLRNDQGEVSASASGDIVGGVQKRVTKRPYKKYYSNPTPSSHCHVCARTSKAVKIAVCARIAEGLCRKVTCYKCFMRFGWDWEDAMRGGDWVCVHCRGVCPEGRSQCYIYSRVNSKRERRRGGKKKTGEGGG